MLDTSFMFYAMEEEGLLNTRTSKINAAIKDFKYYKARGYNIQALKDEILAKHGLTESSLTYNDCRRIEREVGRA